MPAQEERTAKTPPVKSCFAGPAEPAFHRAGKGAPVKYPERVPGFTGQAKKEFFLCRVDGKGKGFALRRSFQF